MNRDDSFGASGVSRREFVKLAVATGVAAATAPSPAWAADAAPLAMPRRKLGRTGETVSAIGLGGYHLAEKITEAESLRIIRSAIDRGITFMDNCWDYNDGESERRMGKALRDGYRNKVFLMTKIDGRRRATALKQLNDSLKRLQADHLDLVQIHEVIRMEDPDRVFAPDGAIEALVAARALGKVRWIGFTGHKDPMIHLRMLEMAAKHSFRFDAVQMPLNVMDAHFRSFEQRVLPELVKQEIGVLGMKPMGSGIILQSNTVKPIECLHYALNLPTSVVITGIDKMEILDQALEAAQTFKPMSQEQVASLLARTAEAAKDGKYELFKTGTRFDSTAQHPEWVDNVKEG